MAPNVYWTLSSHLFSIRNYFLRLNFVGCAGHFFWNRHYCVDCQSLARISWSCPAVIARPGGPNVRVFIRAHNCIFSCEVRLFSTAAEKDYQGSTCGVQHFADLTPNDLGESEINIFWAFLPIWLFSDIPSAFISIILFSNLTSDVIVPYRCVIFWVLQYLGAVYCTKC